MKAVTRVMCEGPQSAFTFEMPRGAIVRQSCARVVGRNDAGMPVVALAFWLEFSTTAIMEFKTLGWIENNVPVPDSAIWLSTAVGPLSDDFNLFEFPDIVPSQTQIDLVNSTKDLGLNSSRMIH